MAKNKKKKTVKKNKVRKIKSLKKQNDDELVFKPKGDWIKQAFVDKKTYEKKYTLALHAVQKTIKNDKKTMPREWAQNV